jgi:hypothetical protein
VAEEKYPWQSLHTQRWTDIPPERRNSFPRFRGMGRRLRPSISIKVGQFRELYGWLSFPDGYGRGRCPAWRLNPG